MTRQLRQHQRDRMVRDDLRGRDIVDVRVLDAMATIPREQFVLTDMQDDAYVDAPLPIEDGQTISQPYIVALMSQSLQLAGGERVLEIGTGSGYQTAILAELGAYVWTVEQSIVLFTQARKRLRELGYASVHCIQSDGTLGVPSEAPFDRILATGSLPDIPQGLLDQLQDGGIFVGPIGDWHCQDLIRIVYHAKRPKTEILCSCRFVPLIGEHGWQH